MNPDFTPNPQAELEARLTAYLLGELPAHEAAALHQKIEDDPRLAQLCDQLRPAIKLLREALANPAEPTHAPATPLKLSSARREKLLAQFKTIAPQEFAPKPKRSLSTRMLIDIAAAFVVLSVLAGLLLPSLAKSKSKSVSLNILGNLKQIQLAKQMWADDNKKSASDIPTTDDLKPYLNGATTDGWPRSISGESYKPGSVGESASAELNTDAAKKLFGRQLHGQSLGKGERQEISLRENGQVAVVDKSKVGGLSFYGGINSTPTPAAPPAATPAPAPAAPTPVSRVGGTIVVLPKVELAQEQPKTTEIPPNAAPTFNYRIKSDTGATSETVASTPNLSLPALREPQLAQDFDSLARSWNDKGGKEDGFNLNVVRLDLEPADAAAEPGDSISSTPQNPASPAKLTPSSAGLVVSSQKRRSLPAVVPAHAKGQLFFSDGRLAQEGEIKTPKLTGETATLNGTKQVAQSENRWGDFNGNAENSALTTAGIPAPIIKADGDSLNPEDSFHAKFGAGLTDKLTVAKVSPPAIANPVDTSRPWNAGTGETSAPGKIVINSGAIAGGSGAFGGKIVLPATKSESTDSFSGATSVVVGAGEMKLAYANPTDFSSALESLDQKAANGGAEGDLLARRSRAIPTEPASIASSVTNGKTVPAKDGTEAQVFHLKNVDAGQLSDLVKGLFPEDAQSSTTSSGSVNSSSVTAVADPRTKSLVVTADKKHMAEISDMIKDVDSEPSVVLPANTNPAILQLAMQSRTKSSSSTPLTTGLSPLYDRRKTMTQSMNQNATSNFGATHMTVQPGEATITLDKDGHGLIVMADDDSWQQIPQAVSKLDSKKAGIVVTGSTRDDVSGLHNLLADEQRKKEIPVQMARVAGDSAIFLKRDYLAQADAPLPHVAPTALTPQLEVLTSTNAFSTFSLNVSDVSFKLAAASLEKGLLPDPGAIRSEEFINAFDYRDPEPAPGAPLAFAFDRVQYPFAQNRDLVRFGIKTAAAGRTPGRALNLVLLLDNSGSMERADRVQIIHEALRVLATQLQPQDTISVVTFARNARLQVDGWTGNRAAEVTQLVDGLTPEGGTNLEEAMRVAYETAQRHYLAAGDNRVVLLTDGAANLGNVDPVALQKKVETNRKQGIALDCFGIGWEGYNDDLLETLSRHGDGRYGFINTPEAAATDFAGQLAGALHVAAADVKAQIEFNPQRVTAYRQIGYAKHQLTKEQFRDNTVDAAEIGAAEEGNALYTVQINPAGEGPIGTVRVRFKVPGTSDYREHEWTLPYTGNAPALEQGAPAMRLAATASAFSEWLGQSPFAADVTPDALLKYLNGVPAVYGADTRPQKLEGMIREAKSLEAK